MGKEILKLYLKETTIQIQFDGSQVTLGDKLPHKKVNEKPSFIQIFITPE